MDAAFIRRLTDEPKHHPDCCLAISHPFLVSLLNLLPQSPSLVLSIGSGTGYLEACLLDLIQDESLNLLGLEVSPTVNKYLPEENFVYVNGTWDLYQGAASAHTFLFVYPREPRLMERYIQQFGQASCEKIIWIGPKLDWPDYETVLLASDFVTVTIPRNNGLAHYDMLSVATKMPPQ